MVMFTSQLPISRRSCDPCRARKVACDRHTPCANCQNARLECTHSPISSRARESRKPKATVDNEQLNDIAASITGLWQFVQGLKLNPEGSPTSTESGAAQAAVAANVGSDNGSSLTALEQEQQAEKTLSFEGDSSLRVQLSRLSGLMSSIIRPELLAADNESSSSNPYYAEKMLTSLNRLAVAYEADSIAHDMDLPYAKLGFGDAQMPPLESILTVLRWARANADQLVPDIYSHAIPLDEVIAMCQKVYFAVDTFTQMEFTLATGLLVYLFLQYATSNSNARYQEYSCQYGKRFQARITSLPLLLPATLETVVNLIIGASHAIDLAKATLAWTLISNASNLCQTMGYHRTSSMDKDDQATREKKISIFWSVFQIEKGLSLCLGRTSTIHEWDVPMPSNTYSALRVRHAYIQSKAYDNLYSLYGLALSTKKRTEVAQNLAGEMRQLIQDCELVDTPPSSHSKTQSIDLMAQRTQRLATLALICRAITPSPSSPRSRYSPESIDAAHAALEAHDKTMNMLQPHTSLPYLYMKYMNSTILGTPFAPLIISFCRAMTDRDTEELARVERFAESITMVYKVVGLEPSRPARIFQLLYEVAKLHIEHDGEAASSSVGSGDPSAGGGGDFGRPSDNDISNDELNDYINSFGFPITPLSTIGFNSAAAAAADTLLNDVQTTAADASFNDNSGTDVSHDTQNDLTSWYYASQQLTGQGDGEGLF